MSVRSTAILSVLILALLARAVMAEEPMQVRYVGNNTGLVSEDYYLALLAAALDATESSYGAYELVYTNDPLSSERKHELLVTGTRVNVDRLVGFAKYKGARKGLIRVTVPLLNGFMGYRILLIRRENQALFRTVNTLGDLTKLPMGLGKGWEGDIYKQNGFKVAEPLTMDSLLKMLAGKRYYFVPLSVVEIEDHYEIEGSRVENLVPEQTLLLYMPLPMYFYVSPEYPKLAERLTTGLIYIKESGKVDKIFKEHFGERLHRLRLAERTLIELANPDDDGSLGVPNHALLREF